MDRESIVKAMGVEAAKASPPVAVVAHQAANGWTLIDPAGIIHEAA